MKWEEVKLGELYTVHNGLSKSKDFFGSGFPFLSFSTVFKNYFIPEKIIDLVQSSETERKTFSIKKGDVFITRTSETIDELGMSCVALRDIPNATYNGFTKRMRPIDSNKVCPKYIGYFLRTSYFRNKFIAFSNMTTRASLKNEDLLSMTIFLPPYPVQQKIAGILSAYDDLIENNQKQIKLLEEAAQRLYKEWFVDFRFPGHETAKFINGLPEGWKKERINNFFHVSIGKTPPRNEKKCFTNKNGIPWISIADMGKASVFIKETAENLTKDAIEKYNVKIIPANSILLSFKLTVGRVSITTKEMCSNEAIAHFITDDQFIKEYCFLYLKNFKYETLGSTSSISNAINSKIVKEIPFVFPSQKILENFYNLSKDFFERIKILTDQISLLQEARDRLLPKLMNGEIEV